MNVPTPDYDARFEADLERLQEKLRVESGGGDAASHDGAFREALAVQQAIDESVRRQFAFAEAPPEAHLAELTKALTANSPGRNNAPGETAEVVAQPIARRRIVHLVLAAAAIAAVAATVAMWRRPNDGDREPYFAATPLTEVYQQTVAAGFEPYYECRDPERFADVFRQRQGQPLQLATMPAGARMLGLSYPGGLSRQTTAMLCEVDGKRVIAFVDLAEADDPRLATSTDPELHVFREQRDGLVFYEVTPLDEPRVLEFLEPAR